METFNPGNWSKLPFDILISLFNCLNFVDFHRAKMVCSNWYCVSKQTVPWKSGSPWIMLFLEESGCFMLYNPDEDKIYKTARDLSGNRFLIFILFLMSLSPFLPFYVCVLLYNN
ncbi:F-box protein [Cardamine amara subsp. amara]|uniref:F-box protein n=1 Tax=Cardamine amara subsp. amara TaxID=228776 RepID=A0ABD1A467_CARAN